MKNRSAGRLGRLFLNVATLESCSSESVVANIKEDTPAMPAGGAGMGGMM